MINNKLPQLTTMSEKEINEKFNGIDIKWEAIDGKPSEFQPSEHQHSISDIKDLTLNWDSIEGKPNQFPSTEHSHSAKDVTGVDEHIKASVTSASGIHGIKFSNNSLQVLNGSSWVEVGKYDTSLPPITNLAAIKTNDKVTLKWNDPADTSTSKWAGTKIVRKLNSAPQNPNDWTLVLNSTTRNKYASSGFLDSGLADGNVYVYAAFPYTSNGTHTISSQSIASVDYRLTDEDKLCSGQAYRYYNVGDEIYLSMTGLGNMKFIVVGKEIDGVNTITLCSERVLGECKFSNTSTNDSDHKGAVYSTSVIRSTLISTYLPKFSSKIQNAIKSVNKECPDGTVNDKIWLFSTTETGTDWSIYHYDNLGFAYPYFTYKNLVKIDLNNNAKRWWMRDRSNNGRYEKYNVWYIENFDVTNETAKSENDYSTTYELGVVFGIVF